MSGGEGPHSLDKGVKDLMLSTVAGEWSQILETLCSLQASQSIFLPGKALNRVSRIYRWGESYSP